MKYHLFTLLCFSLTMWTLDVKAQESVISAVNVDHLNKMVQLAKEHVPQRKIMELNEEVAKSEVNAQKVSYLDAVDVSYFYRPEDQTALGTANPYIVNGFQLGVNVNLGSLFQKPFQNKQAKANHKIAQFERVAYEGELENEVKRRYYAYIRTFSELKIKTQQLQDNKALNDDLQLRFERGEIALEAYTEAKTALSEASSDKLETEVYYLVAKDALEQLIGQDVDQVIDN